MDLATEAKRRSSKAGLSPGTLVHIGEKKRENVRIGVLDYSETHLEEREIDRIEECFTFKEKPTVTWINIEGLHDSEVIEKLGECYGFHPLVLEDILNTDQRPKLEDYTDYLFIVMKMLSLSKNGHDVESEQISLIVGSNFVISFQEGREGDVFDPVRQRIRSGKGRLRKAGADYLAYALVDAIVDGYFAIMETLGERIELLEEDLVTNPQPSILHDIHNLKRQMVFLRRAVWPLREVIGSLQRGESALVREMTRIYLRDVYDHTIQVIETVETFRDMVSGMLDIYLSSISNRLNAVMKVLTMIATIFMPLTFIAGIYGMNFKYMPELEWRWGYPFALFVMLLVALTMLVYFRKKKWL
jgi:magnesium transporter